MKKDLREELPERVRGCIADRSRSNHSRMERVAMLYTPSRKLRQHHEASRAARGVCKACYYIHNPKIVGQAFTDYVCGICCQTARHHNTGVPLYCPTCCKKYELCGSCGGANE